MIDFWHILRQAWYNQGQFVSLIIRTINIKGLSKILSNMIWYFKLPITIIRHLAIPRRLQICPRLYRKRPSIRHWRPHHQLYLLGQTINHHQLFRLHLILQILLRQVLLLPIPILITIWCWQIFTIMRQQGAIISHWEAQQAPQARYILYTMEPHKVVYLHIW